MCLSSRLTCRALLSSSNPQAKHAPLDVYRMARVGGNNRTLQDYAIARARHSSTAAASHIPRQHLWLVPLIDKHMQWVAGVPCHISPDARTAVALAQHRANPVRGIVSASPNNCHYHTASFL